MSSATSRLNMNRLFREEYDASLDRTCYEFVRTQQLKTLLVSCDYFIDLHSAPFAQQPFLVAEARAVGTIGGDAENFAGSHGALAATVEAGSHFDRSAFDVSYRTALTPCSGDLSAGCHNLLLRQLFSQGSSGDASGVHSDVQTCELCGQVQDVARCEHHLTLNHRWAVIDQNQCRLRRSLLFIWIKV